MSVLTKLQFHTRLDVENGELLDSMIEDKDATLESLKEDGDIDAEYFDYLDEVELFGRDFDIMAVRAHIPISTMAAHDLEVFQENIDEVDNINLAEMCRQATRDALRFYAREQFIKVYLDVDEPSE